MGKTNDSDNLKLLKCQWRKSNDYKTAKQSVILRIQVAKPILGNNKKQTVLKSTNGPA